MRVNIFKAEYCAQATRRADLGKIDWQASELRMTVVPPHKLTSSEDPFIMLQNICKVLCKPA